VKIPTLRAPQNKLLLLIFLALTTSTVVWTLRDQTPPPWDPSDHLRYGYDYYRLLAHADFSGFLREFFSTRHYYAPLVHLISALVFLLVGASKLTGIGVNLVSLIALLWSVAWISRHLYAQESTDPQQSLIQSRWSLATLSALPALISASYHFSAWLLHDAFLDFPLMAAVTVSFAFLIRADDFTIRRNALAFGVSAGLGMLVKQTFAFFFVLSALYVVGRVLWNRERKAVLNLALAAVVLVLIASIWYAPHWQDVLAIYRENQQAAVNENEAPLFTFDSNFFYVHALLSMQMQLPLAIIFVFGLLYSLVRHSKRSLILYLWIISGIGCFALVANKDVRYTVPVLPAAALLSTCWIGTFGARSGSASKRTSRVFQVTLISATAAWSLVSFFNAQWPKPGFGTAIDTPRYRWMVFARNYYGFDHYPLLESWAVPEIVQSLSGESPTPVLGVVVNLPYLNPSSMALYSRLLNNERAGPPLIDVRWVVEPSMISRIDECDYILVRTGLDKAEWVAKIERDVEALIRENPDKFTRYISFPIPLPDAEAIVYRHEKR